MTEFVRVARAVARLDKPGTCLVSEVPLKELQIAIDYPVGKWLADPVNHDRWQQLRLLQSKAPYTAVFPAGETFLDVEYHRDGNAVDGLAAAHLMDGMAVSLPVDRCWDAPHIRVVREQLVEGPDDELVPHTDEVDVRHVSAVPHVDEHRDWILANRLKGIRTGRDMWDRREAVYPHLQFLPRVKNQLTDLVLAWVGPVGHRLDELEQAVAAWDPTHQAHPDWLSKVTPEGETRKRECWFDDDGQKRLFDLHARFTPRAGRIHFRLVAESHAIRIAHIGLKIKPEL